MDQNNSDYLVEKKCPYISFPILEQLPWLKHGFSTRLGGVSTGIHSSMNLGFLNGDRRENVEENYHRMAATLNIDVDSCVMANQTHSDRVRLVTGDDRGKGFRIERDYTDIDALITKEAGNTLVILTADCVPVSLADTVNHAVGLVHSGWKGTAAKIVPKTIIRMQEEFGTHPENLVIATGPSICGTCYEVGSEVINHFHEQYTECQCKRFITIKMMDTPDNPLDKSRTYLPEEKYQLDLAEAIRQSVVALGVPDKSIVKSSFCTMCHPELFFSHRATQGKRGTMAAFISTTSQANAE